MTDIFVQERGPHPAIEDYGRSPPRDVLNAAGEVRNDAPDRR
jgi:hypothetical protein